MYRKKFLNQALALALTASIMVPQTSICSFAEENDEDISISEYVENGDFETGDFTGWMFMDKTPIANESNDVGVVSDETSYWGSRNMYIHGNYCMRGESKESLSGAIRSSSFRLGGDGYISFMIGAAAKEGRGCIRLYEETPDGDNLIKTYTNTNWNDPKTGLTLIRVFDKLDEKYMGKILYFVIENGSESGFSFINADDFRTSMTREEVINLQESQISEIEAVEDEYSDYVISCYRKNGIINDLILKEDAPDIITKYEGQSISFADTIASGFKVEKEYSKELIDVDVVINEVLFDGQKLDDYENDVKLKTGSYLIYYSVSYGDNTYDKSIEIKVEPVDKNINKIENPGFETGDLTGWEVVTKDVWNKNADGTYAGVSADATYWGERMPYNQSGNYHLDGWKIANDEADTWRLRSSVFTLAGSGWVSVKMGGKAAAFRVYELDGSLIGEYKQNRFSDINFPYIDQGGSWADMGKYFVDLHEYVGNPLYIELCDNNCDGGWRVAFFDDVRTYYESKPDIKNSYDTVEGPIERDGDRVYDDIKIPWQEVKFIKGDVKLSFEDEGFNVSNSLGQKSTAELESNFKNPKFQDNPVMPYRPNGIKGKALNFDGYSNYVQFDEMVSGAKLTVDAYVCPRAFMWDSPETKREDQIMQVIAGSYDTGTNSGFAIGITKHGYIAFRAGTGDNWYSMSSDDGKKVKLYKWNRVTGVFDGTKGIMKIYLNGEEVANKKINLNSEIVPSNRPLRIGKGSESVIVADNTFDGTMFAGLMDEVTVEMTALSDKEVKESGYDIVAISYAQAKAPASALSGDYYRPTYHAAPPANWMNEPHTLFSYNGKWHLFYQSNQEGPYWHNISWGHFVSEDMVNWEHVVDAVVPMDDTVATDGVWTGNVVFSSDGKPLLLITAGDDTRSINGSNQHVGLAKATDYTDPYLTDWEVVGYSVAQTSEMGTAGEFRDAQAFGIGDMRYMVVGGAEDGRGVAHVFRTKAKTVDEWEASCKSGSLNGMDWEYMGSLFGDFYEKADYKRQYGTVWELPNLVPLTDGDGNATSKYLFVFSPQNGDNDVWYYIGDFDENECRFKPDFEDAKLMDYGNNIFTGPTVYTNPDDGKVYINSVMQENASDDEIQRPISDHYYAGWAFYAGLTRNLYLKQDGSLGIRPVDTASVEGKELISFKNKTITQANELLAVVNSDTVKIEFEIKGIEKEAGFNLKESDSNASRFFITADSLGLDNQSGSYKVGESVKGTIFVDKCSIEAYVDDAICISGSKFFKGKGLSVFGDSDTIISAKVTEMKPILLNRETNKNQTGQSNTVADSNANKANNVSTANDDKKGTTSLAAAIDSFVDKLSSSDKEEKSNDTKRHYNNKKSNSSNKSVVSEPQESDNENIDKDDSNDIATQISDESIPASVEEDNSTSRSYMIIIISAVALIMFGGLGFAQLIKKKGWKLFK